jgi:hypothetical protein
MVWKRLILVCGCVLLYSCNNKLYYGSPSVLGYVPGVANVNLQKEKGDLQNTSFLGRDHFENQSSYNISKNLFAQTNAYFAHYLKYAEGGLGYYKLFAWKQLMSSTSLGYGYGKMDALEQTVSSGKEPIHWNSRTFFYEGKNISNSSFTNKIYVQSNLSWFANEKYCLSLGARLNLVYMNNYVYRVETYQGLSTGYVTSLDVQETRMDQKKTQILDANITLARNFKAFTWYLQALVNIPLKKGDQNTSNHILGNSMFPLLSAGLMFNFNLLKRKHGPIKTE